MARTRKYSNRIYRYPKQKWAPVIKSGTAGVSNNSHAIFFDLVANSSDTATPTPTVLKVKHMKMQIDASIAQGGAVITGLRAGVIFVPEGITVTNETQLESLIASHPEWIMLFDLIECGDDAYPNTVRSSCPLSRNLNSGDRICFFAWATADSGVFTCKLSYILRWVVRAN